MVTVKSSNMYMVGYIGRFMVSIWNLPLKLLNTKCDKIVTTLNKITYKKKQNRKNIELVEKP